MTLPNELHPGFFSAGGGADLGDTIEQSLRFTSGPYLNRNATTPTDATKFTLSFWLKRGKNNSEYQTVMYAGVDAQNKNDALWFYPYAIELNQRRSNTDYQTTTNALFRDPTAWYHVVYTWSSGTRVIYVNGVSQSFSRNTTTTATHYWQTNGITQEIGRDTNNGGSPANRGDFYLAAYHFIDGQALNATDFGKFNNDGVWVPQNYTGTYGSNGFHLTFDSSQSNGIGHDSSGNGNHFTANLFETSALSNSNIQNDIDIEDTPTSNIPTGNPLRTIGTIRYGNMEFQNDSSTYTKTDGTISFPTSGVWQYEYHYISSQLHVGYKDSSVESPNTSTPPTTEAGHWFIVNNKNYFENGAAAVSIGGANITAGQIITFIFDADNEQAKWYIDGTLRWTDDTPNRTTYPHLVPFMGTFDSANEWNFGQWPFRYTPVSDAKALSAANIPEPTIKDGSDHFQAIIDSQSVDLIFYNEGSITGSVQQSIVTTTPLALSTSGNGNSFLIDLQQSVTSARVTWGTTWSSVVSIWCSNDGSTWTDTGQAGATAGTQYTYSISGASFRYVRAYYGSSFSNSLTSAFNSSDAILSLAQAAFPTGFYWIKDRQNSSTQHQLVDTIRGTSIAKLSPQNGAQTSYSAPTGSSVAWCWKSGAASTNGFNMFQYTGNSSSTQAVAHGLPSTPEFIITYSQSQNSGMPIYHTKLPSGEVLNIDSSAAPASTTIYSSVDGTNITFGGTYNTDGEDYMCYAWTSIDAYSKMGSYIGNQSADGPFVYLGFKPSWILLKRGDIANWRIFDSSRNQYNPMDLMLWPNLGDAEGTDPYGSGDVVDFLSNGFKIRATGTTMNASNDTIYYVAFAELPFGGQNVPPATAR